MAFPVIYGSVVGGLSLLTKFGLFLKDLVLGIMAFGGLSLAKRATLLAAAIGILITSTYTLITGLWATLQTFITGTPPIINIVASWLLPENTGVIIAFMISARATRFIYDYVWTIAKLKTRL